MVLGVAVDRVPLVGERGNDPRIGGEAGRKEQRRFGAEEFGESVLQLLVQRRPAAHERAGPPADALLTKGLDRGASQSLVGGEAQIIIRGEIDDPFARDFHHGPRSTECRRQRAQEIGSFEPRKFFVYPAERVHVPMVAGGE